MAEAKVQIRIEDYPEIRQMIQDKDAHIQALRTEARHLREQLNEEKAKNAQNIERIVNEYRGIISLREETIVKLEKDLQESNKAQTTLLKVINHYSNVMNINSKNYNRLLEDYEKVCRKKGSTRKGVIE